MRTPARKWVAQLVIALLVSVGIQAVVFSGSANAVATRIDDDGSNSSAWTNNVTVVPSVGNPGSAFGFSKNDLIGHSFGTSAADFAGATIQFDAKFTNVQDHIAVFWGRGISETSGTANALYIGPAGNSGSGSPLSGAIGLQMNASGPQLYWNGISGGITGTGNGSVTAGSWEIDRWYTIKVVISSSSTSYFVDNTSIQTMSSSIPTSNYVTIGGDDRNGWGFTNGVFVDNLSLIPAIPPKVITYNYNGASGTNSVSSDDYTDTAITLPVPTKTGSTFMGWFESSDLSGLRVSANYSPNADLTLHAKWSSDSVPVNFNTDGGSFVAGSSVAIGSSIQSAPTAPTKNGYTFGGWKATSGGSAVAFPYYPILSTAYATSVSSAALVDLGRYENKGAWVSSTWYGPNRGTTPNSTRDFVTYVDGLKYIAIRESNNSVLTGSTRLDGYYLVPLDSSTTLTAIWTVTNHSATFDSRNGVNSSIATVSEGSYATTPASPSWYGYNFKGWSESANGSLVDVSTIAINSAKTFYAIWEQKSIAGLTSAQLGTPDIIAPHATLDKTATAGSGTTSSVVKVPAGALPSTYSVKVYTLADNDIAEQTLGTENTYIISQVVAWSHATDGTIQDTAAGKPIEMTITSPEIKTGAKVYSILGNVTTLLATATQDGSVRVTFSTDPVIVVQAAPIVPPSPTPIGGGGATPTPSPSALPVTTVAKSFNVLGFNPGSWQLTKDIKKTIDAFFKSVNKPSKISCVGYTMGPTVLHGDYSLAMRRGQAVCKYVVAKNPTIAKMTTKGTTTRISDGKYRRATILWND